MGRLKDWLGRRVVVTIVLPGPAATKEENAIMGFRMTGVWTRRDIVFPDKQALERAKEFALTKAPITINSYPELKAEYLAIYGQDEAENLAKGNLVQSNQQRYVKNGTWAPPDPKPPEPEPGPDEEAVNTPFGTIVRKKRIGPPTDEMRLSDITWAEFRAAQTEDTMQCLKAIFPEKF